MVGEALVVADQKVLDLVPEDGSDPVRKVPAQVTVLVRALAPVDKREEDLAVEVSGVHPTGFQKVHQVLVKVHR